MMLEGTNESENLEWLQERGAYVAASTGAIVSEMRYAKSRLLTSYHFDQLWEMDTVSFEQTKQHRQKSLNLRNGADLRKVCQRKLRHRQIFTHRMYRRGQCQRSRKAVNSGTRHPKDRLLTRGATGISTSNT